MGEDCSCFNYTLSDGQASFAVIEELLVKRGGGGGGGGGVCSV